MPDAFWLFVKFSGYIVIIAISLAVSLAIAGVALFIAEKLYHAGDDERHYRGLHESLLRHVEKGGVTRGK